MGYSVEEWFEDCLIPRLKIVIDTLDSSKNEPYDPNKEYESLYDKFISSIKGSLNEREDERFTTDMLKAILNPGDEDMDIVEGMRLAFNNFTGYNNDTLLKIEYRKDGATTVVVNYQDYEKDEDNK